ncbi:PREDICTED: agamous-like MADS-box protein AGL61, partial [Lupinus angustifolius]|uniref:agamous-like MADS-box protein AGL61 n=1 Tax=Lupinus angustifolius TaxID=3871 RepID=UPI00092EEB19
KIHGVANGLFKKANERCSLCDTEVALIIFSPANKLFSFGESGVDEQNEKISRINEALESEKKYCEELAKQRKEAQEQFWWVSPIQEMNGDQLDKFKLALENLKKNVLGVVEKQNIADVDVADTDV